MTASQQPAFRVGAHPGTPPPHRLALFDALVTIADQRSVSEVAQRITTVLADRADQEAAQ